MKFFLVKNCYFKNLENVLYNLSLNLFLLYRPLYMEENTKGIRKENVALSVNIRLVIEIDSNLVI